MLILLGVQCTRVNINKIILILSFIISFLAVDPMLTDRRSEMANSGDGQTTLPYSTVLYYCTVLQVLVHSFSVSSDDLALYISRVE